MKGLLPALAIVGAAMIGGRPDAARTPRFAGLCRSSDNYATGMVTQLRELATTADSKRLIFRDSVKLASADSATIVIVSDTTLCRRASESLRHARFNADTGELE